MSQRKTVISLLLVTVVAVGQALGREFEYPKN
jgi:hypothetical protein